MKQVIKSMIFFVIGIAVTWFLISHVITFTQYYYFFKNGSKVELRHYQIRFPNIDWVRLTSTDTTHTLSGGRINDKSLFVNIAIDNYEVELNHLLETCDEITQENKQFNDVNGTMYFCETNHSKIMYFYSDDGFFLLQADPYFADDNIIARYEELLNSVRKQEYDLSLKEYQLKLPSPHWVPVDNNKAVYTLSGGWINHKGIFAHVAAVDWQDMEMENLLNKKCITVNKKKKQFNDINGTMYLCKNNIDKTIMYFYSNDGYFLLRADDYSLDKQRVERYEELLNAIRKKDKP